MKKYTWLTLLLAMILLLGSIGTAHATIQPPYGEGQIGLRAAILCEELTLREKASASSKALQTLPYGSLIIVTKQSDGWAYCVLGDAEDSPSGWVNADYIVIDPAWYVTDEKIPVYAWNDTNAPKVGLIDKGTTLPILKDDGEWLVVSLRGASGWIHKSAADLRAQ